MPGPPPPPPPPPMGGGPGGGAEGGRGQLLGAIHRGVALKKTVTNDRSAPIPDKAKPVGASNNGGNNTGGRGPIRPANNNAGSGGGPPLAGLFAGGMPKLKPTNRGPAGDASTPPPSSSPANASRTNAGWTPPPTASPANGSRGNNGTPGNKRAFPSDVKNRGPPPQPPPAAFKPVMPAAESDNRKHRNASLKKELSATRIVQQGIGRLTNKPDGPGRIPAGKISQLQARLEGQSQSIANTMSTTVNVASTTPPSDANATSTKPPSNVTSAKSEANTRAPAVKVTSMKDGAGVGETGDVARIKKRLSVSLVEAAKPEQVVTRNNVSNIKRQLSRHGIEDTSTSEGRLSAGSRGSHGKPHLAPRPPSDPPASRKEVSRAQSLRAPRSPPVMPPHFQPPAFQSNSIGHATSTSGLHQAPGAAPDFRTLPSKGRPRPPMSRPPPPPSRPPPPPVHAPPPPPPPHRTLPHMPTSNNVNANNAPANGQHRLQPGPPPTPARNSSMRGAEMFERNFTWRGANEFPRPPPFLARPKVFNSVSVRMAGGGGKAQAPQPPVLQLGNKMFTRDTSRC